MVKTEERLMAMYANANPVEVEDLRNMVELDNAKYLATLEKRSSEVTQLDTKKNDQKEKKTASPWLVAAAVAIVAGIGLIVVNQGSEAPLVSQPDAEASVDAWFDAYNAGDDEAVLALFAPGVAISSSFGPGESNKGAEAVEEGSSTLDEWTMFLAWNTAQGSNYTPQECSVDEIDSGVSVTVTCSTGSRDGLGQAVDSPPVATDLVVVVTAEGISEISFEYERSGFTQVGGRFSNWMAVNHPEIVEAGTVGFGNWATVEEARANGLLTAQYGAEWATYLTENGCTYRDLRC